MLPQKLADGSGIVASDRLPVDDIPEGRDVIGPAVLVVEVVGVLPPVDGNRTEDPASRNYWPLQETALSP